MHLYLRAPYVESKSSRASDMNKNVRIAVSFPIETLTDATSHATANIVDNGNASRCTGDAIVGGFVENEISRLLYGVCKAMYRQ
jgi:hypothetical protein